MKKKFLLSFMLMCISIFALGMLTVSAYTGTKYGNYLYYKESNGEIRITDCDETATVIDIPETIGGKKVTSIGDWAFSDCSGLTSVTIPDSVSTIGYYAFIGCSGLTSVYVQSLEAYLNCEYNDYSNPMCYAKKLYVNNQLVKGNVEIPNTVKKIPEYAFSNCIKITDITIPDSVSTIGYSAFKGCSGLTSITIPDSVSTIGYYAFSDCSGLTSVYVQSLEAYLNCEYNNDSSNPMCNAEKLYVNNQLVKGNVEIPNTVKKIPGYAFSNCIKITDITIPDSVITIGGDAFSYCSGLTSVTMGDSVTTIGDYAFKGCSGLTSITIPDSVTIIGDGAFRYCRNISTVYYNGTDDEWDEIYIYSGNDALTNATRKSGYEITLIAENEENATIICWPNTKLKLSDIEKKYMHKVTLYTDEKMTKEFDTTTAITNNMTLYVKLGEEITVIYGDIDDDGEITMNDAIYLFNAVMFPEQYSIPSGQKTDYNGDGNFDMNDAIYLFNHAMFPEQYPI